MAPGVSKEAETWVSFTGRKKCYIRYFDAMIFGLKDYHGGADHLRLSRQCLPQCLAEVFCFLFGPVRLHWPLCAAVVSASSCDSH